MTAGSVPEIFLERVYVRGMGRPETENGLGQTNLNRGKKILFDNGDCYCVAILVHAVIFISHIDLLTPWTIG